MNNDKDKQIDLKESIRLYFKGIKSEWGKITWPQRPQIIAETIVVLIVVAFITTVVYLIDIGFKGIFHFFHLT